MLSKSKIPIFCLLVIVFCSKSKYVEAKGGRGGYSGRSGGSGGSGGGTIDDLFQSKTLIILVAIFGFMGIYCVSVSCKCCQSDNKYDPEHEWEQARQRMDRRWDTDIEQNLQCQSYKDEIKISEGTNEMNLISEKPKLEKSDVDLQKEIYSNFLSSEGILNKIKNTFDNLIP